MDTNIGVLENAVIQVVVESVTPDMIVVSYTAINGSVYQGILLNNVKRRFPCGSVPMTKPPLSPRNLKTESDNDILYSVSQRFTYFQNTPNTLKKIPSKTKKVRKPMTVRLRPRQVLCSKCKSNCTENSDNVETSKDLVKNENNTIPEKRLLRSHGPVPEFPIKPSDSVSTVSQVKSMCRTLIPKLVKIKSREITEALNNYSKFTELDEWVGNKKDCEDDCDIEEKMVLRKKPSIGSMEDLWDETAFEETKKTPIIKITFGSQGEGTVMEIPSRQADGDSEPDKLLRKRAKRRRQDGEKRKKHKKRHKEHEDDLEMNNFSIHLNNFNSKEEYCARKETNSSESINNVNGQLSDDDIESNSSPELVMPQIETSDSNSFFVLKSGKILHEGDVVWGKVKGFPWWPAKVSNFTTSNGEENGSFVNVTWFGSSTTSFLNCDQINPFLDFYKSRFNKHKKTSSYKEAIKQAMAIAKQQQNTTNQNIS
ncbi:PWWP domain-containing protein 2A [Acyrthosiphon pisum]|uniref:PWWP domain-containing protein n=1 Tax=Acyrthosiphon pisum TaxID=7029 RepID=A0A8R2NQ60_ACYPI|nr:PWWP domain-containing protein 2A [Acyrthosiphon pisum]XP_029343841.1 PWWP domain-containing protein 2A [Acyrthosiphon pisum]|eukprot:XP_008187829.1 PREDICTED: PWWP domain-containing protein 2A [Acyrthosiphon pisum]